MAQQQNLSESVSSIYHGFDGHIRYSGSEPINTNLQALENQFNMKLNKEADSDEANAESKASVNQIAFTNNFERSSTKENDMNLITSASIIKDNQANISGCSLNNSQTNKKQSKKKMLASSDSDFFSLLRYNSEKLRRINCFSISTNNNGNKPKNMIYALSDSDFLIGVNDKNKNLNLDNERKFQAIANKSDIFNFLINQKSIDYKNLLDNNFAQNNHHQKKKSSDVENKKHFDNPDLFNMEKLKAVFGESAAAGSDNAKIIESISLNDDISAAEKIQKKETVSLPPIMNANNDFHNVMLNNSRSIDTVLLNMKNNADTLPTAKPSYDFSKNSFSQKNLYDESSNVNSVMSESLRKLNDCTNIQSVHDDNNKSCTKCYDVMNPVTLDDKNIARRKRTPSNVTYNVNVINFQADDEPDTISGGYGKRSNSSTSELRYIYTSHFHPKLKSLIVRIICLN